MEEFLIVVALILIVVGVFCGVVSVTAYTIHRPTCLHTLDKMGADGSWGFWLGVIFVVTFNLIAYLVEDAETE